MATSYAHFLAIGDELFTDQLSDLESNYSCYSLSLAVKSVGLTVKIMRKNVQIDSSAAKKRRITYNDNNGEDVISNLPESTISRILSHLPTKDVMRTCVLSKGWEYKWTSICNIEIDDRERFLLKKTRKTNFVNFVDRIFFLSRNSTLKRFRLRCRHKYDSRHVISWISAALMRNVEDLEIVYNGEGVVLPRCFFDCTSLTKVKLQSPCIFRVSAQNLFSSLRFLYLSGTKILGERVPSTSQLMFDFPVLETLRLQNCEWLKLNFVEINSPALTKVNVVHHHSSLPGVDKYQIKISGAKLAKFEYDGPFVEHFDFGMSSAFSAAVIFNSYADDGQVTRKNGLQTRLLLKGLSGLNHLKLSGHFVDEWSIARLASCDAISGINHLSYGMFFATLSTIHRLEKMVACVPSSGLLMFLQWLWEDYDYDEVEPVPSCIVSHLNEVQFRGFIGRRPHVRMADFLLTNALQLKKMLGLCRSSSEERETVNFWAKLRSVFKNGDLIVGSSIKDTVEFELKFG